MAAYQLACIPSRSGRETQIEAEVGVLGRFRVGKPHEQGVTSSGTYFCCDNKVGLGLSLQEKFALFTNIRRSSENEVVVKSRFRQERATNDHVRQSLRAWKNTIRPLQAFPSPATIRHVSTYHDITSGHTRRVQQDEEYI